MMDIPFDILAIQTVLYFQNKLLLSWYCLWAVFPITWSVSFHFFNCFMCTLDKLFPHLFSVVSRSGSVAGTLVVKNDDANCFVFWLIMYHKQGKQSDHGRIFSLQSGINLEGATEPNPLVDVFSHYVCFKRKCIDIVRRNSSLVTPRRKRAN